MTANSSYRAQIMTYVKGKYRLSAQSRDVNELIKELTLALRMLAQDAAVKNGMETIHVLQEIVYDIEDACGQ